jgi:DNA-binding NtrC family response regulator
MDLLCAYRWPGNVRQLINVVEQVVVLCERDVIEPSHLPPPFREGGAHPLRRFGSNVVPLVEVEKQYIEFAVKQMNGHRAKAARALHVSERSLYRKLREYGID